MNKRYAPIANALLSYLLGLGIVASTFTKFRLGGLPFGLGEICLTVWIVVQLILWLAQGKSLLGIKQFILIFAVFSFFLIIFAGGFFNQSILSREIYNSFDYGDFIRNTFAFIFNFIFISTALLRIEDNKRDIMAISVVVWIYLAVSILLFFFTSIVTYQGLRLAGFSENPNQFALLIIFAITLYVYNINMRGGLIFNVSGLLICGIAGYLSASDALQIATLITVPTLIALRFILMGGKVKIKALKAFLIILATSISIYILRGKIVDILDHVSTEQGNQGEGRMILWRHGLEAWSNSPIIGLGGGAFSGPMGPFQHTESHNTYIDILTNGGILALIALCFIIFFSASESLKQKRLAPLIGICYLVVFSLFHHVFRQPIFWMLLCLPLFGQNMMKSVALSEKGVIRNVRN